MVMMDICTVVPLDLRNCQPGTSWNALQYSTVQCNRNAAKGKGHVRAIVSPVTPFESNDRATALHWFPAATGPWAPLNLVDTIVWPTM